MVLSVNDMMSGHNKVYSDNAAANDIRTGATLIVGVHCVHETAIGGVILYDATTATNEIFQVNTSNEAGIYVPCNVLFTVGLSVGITASVVRYTIFYREA